MTARLVSSDCPKCRGNVAPALGAGSAKCPYCGASLLVDGLPAPSLPAAPPVANLLKLADAAVGAKNFEEAHHYFTRVLEQQPDNATAWIGKGLAAGQASTLDNNRSGEMRACIDRALALTPPTEKTALAQTAATELANLNAALFNRSFERLEKSSHAPEAWLQHLALCMPMLDALEAAMQLHPTQLRIAKNGLLTAKSLLEGFEHEVVRAGVRHAVVRGESLRLGPEQQARAAQAFRTFGAHCRRLDPKFRVPRMPDPDRVHWMLWLIGAAVLIGLLWRFSK
jgi:tetratricopeptide (TPR) repeat protein